MGVLEEQAVQRQNTSQEEDRLRWGQSNSKEVRKSPGLLKVYRDLAASRNLFPTLFTTLRQRYSAKSVGVEKVSHRLGIQRAIL